MSHTRIFGKLTAALLVCAAAVLLAVPARAFETRDYSLKIKTAYQYWAGTDSDIYVRLIGRSGQTSVQTLDNFGNDFEMGRENTFDFSDADVGELIKVQFFMTGSDDWIMESFTINDVSYAYGRWASTDLITNGGDCYVMEYDIAADEWYTGSTEKDSMSSFGVLHENTLTAPAYNIYAITVRNRDYYGNGNGGTDGNLYARVIGDKGATGIYHLDIGGDDYDDFEKYAVDTYRFHDTAEIGTAQAIQFFFDSDDDWQVYGFAFGDKYYRLGQIFSTEDFGTQYEVFELYLKTGSYASAGSNEMFNYGTISNPSALTLPISEAANAVKPDSGYNVASVFSFGSPVSLAVYGSVFVIIAAAAVWFVLRRKKSGSNA